jgi:hypothetical protein
MEEEDRLQSTILKTNPTPIEVMLNLEAKKRKLTISALTLLAKPISTLMK